MPNLLEVDPSIMERNLLFKDIEKLGLKDEMSIDSLLNIKPTDRPDDVPWKPVKPTPGYCVKLRTEEGDKVFVNVCHTDSIPEPDEISEEKLLQMIMDDDVPSFRIPISIGELHIESDKARNPCSVYDIAVNSKFYRKMDSSEVFNTFFLNVSIQALQEKYSLSLDLKSEKPFLLLKNRKSLGNLQVHRIQQREVKKAPGQLIQEIEPQNQPNKKLIQVIGETDNKAQVESDQVSLRNNKDKVTSVRNKHDENVLKLNKSKIITGSERSGRNSSELQLSPSPSVKTYIGKSIPCKKEPTPEEKGVMESQISKGNLFKDIKHECADLSVNEARRNITGDISQNRGGEYKIRKDINRIHGDISQISGVNSAEISGISENTNQISGDSSGNDVSERVTGDIEVERSMDRVCPGILCIRQYPEVGTPQTLIASIYLNIRSSKEFSLEVDSKRLCVSLAGRHDPWFDISLPFTINPDSAQACFIKQTQRLMVKMDVMKS